MTSQKFLGANSNFCRSYIGKNGMEGPFGTVDGGVITVLFEIFSFLARHFSFKK